jgi:phosphoribosylformimino-5-aminoimidazole carboxamide ribotide isomerase
VDRVVIGSVAVRNPNRVCDWIQRFGGGRITVALDVRWVETEFRVAVDGWTETASTSLWDALGPFSRIDLRHLLCTDISRDGMLSGPNVMLYRSLTDRMPNLQVQASGGVSGPKDLPSLADTGVAGVVVGKALLDGRLPLDALAQRVGSKR